MLLHLFNYNYNYIFLKKNILLKNDLLPLSAAF